MGLLLPLVLYILAACCTATYVPLGTITPFPFHPRGCNDSDVLAVSSSALQDINRDRKEGYVLSLNRVHDVQEHRQGGLGSLFYLTLDVLETDCHVLSKKSWKDCKERNLHNLVYGECKAIFYVNYPKRVLYLPAYNCTLRPVSRKKIVRMCPDCPTHSSLSGEGVQQAVEESLAKFNRENPSKQYSVVKVTWSTSQWVFGPSYFVEYLIKESPCTKSQASSCALQPVDSVPVGLCKGSLSSRHSPLQRDPEKFVSVTCDFFEPQAPATGGEHSTANQGPANLPKVKEPQENNTELTHLPSKAMPRGSVQYVPELKDEEPADAFPVQLDLTTNPQGEPLNVSFLFLEPMSEQPVVLPFPSKQQHSAECPGPAREASPLVLPP